MTATAESQVQASHADRQTHPASILLGVLLLGGGLLLVYAGRHLTFFYDEWAFVLTRRGSSLGTYLDPHNGHFVLVPVLIYKLLFAIVGLRHYTPYLVITVLLHLLSCGLLYVLVRPRLGPWLALIPTALLLFMGSAWQILLWPFQMGYLASVAGGLAALWALEQPTRRRDIAAAVALTIAVASSGVGIPFVAACAAVLIARRAPWRRYWVVAVPLIVFGIWYLGWSNAESTTSDAVLSAPQYIATAAAGATAGIAGLDLSWGPPLLVGLALILVAAWRFRADRAVTPFVFAALVGALAFWGLAAITRADALEPAASRYLYVGAVFILILVAEVAAGIPVTRGWAIAVVLLAAGAIVSNLHVLRAGERGLRTSDISARTSLGAVQLAAPVVAPGFVADPSAAPQVAAGPYLAAVHDLGSPALSLSELERASEGQREEADGVLVKAERVTVRPGRGAVIGSCSRLPVGASQTEVTVRPGATATVLPEPRTRVAVSVRRFGAAAPTPLAAAVTGPATISFPADAAPQVPWRLRVAGSSAAQVCVR